MATEPELRVGAGRPTPQVCIVCRHRTGQYYGRLVWPDEEAPATCPNHKVPQPLFPV